MFIYIKKLLPNFTWLGGLMVRILNNHPSGQRFESWFARFFQKKFNGLKKSKNLENILKIQELRKLFFKIIIKVIKIPV